MLNSIIGKKILEIRGYEVDRRVKAIYPKYILFSDKKHIELENQDHEDYHDCDSDATRWTIYSNSDAWKSIHKNEDKHYPIATRLIG